jgi:hypothetical protein
VRFLLLCITFGFAAAAHAAQPVFVRQIAGHWWVLSAAGYPSQSLPYGTGLLAVQPFDVFDSTASGLLCEQIRRQPARLSVIPAPTRAWVDALRRLGPDQPGKHAYVNFLKDRYGYVVGELNRAYSIDFTSFTDLLAEDFRRLDLSRELVGRDDAVMLRQLAAELASLAASPAMQQCRPGALLLLQATAE